LFLQLDYEFVNLVADLIDLVDTYREPYFHTDLFVFQRRDAGNDLGLRVKSENALNEFCCGCRHV